MWSTVLIYFYAHRGLVEIVALLLIGLGGFAAYSAHERDEGAAECLSANQAARQAQELRDVTDRANDTAAITEEVHTYASAIAAPVFDVPVVGLCKQSVTIARVRHTTAAGSDRHAATDIPAGNSGNSAQSTDAADALVAVGRRADAQTAMLQDYVTRVCLTAVH